MLNPTTIAALATTIGPRWLTPTGSSLSLWIATTSLPTIASAAQPLWRPLTDSTGYAAALGARPAPPFAATDGVILATHAGGREIRTPTPALILTSVPPTASADLFLRLAPRDGDDFADLVRDLLATPAPNAPSAAVWGDGGAEVFGVLPAGTRALNVLRLATILAVARDRVAPRVGPEDVALGVAIAGAAG